MNHCGDNYHKATDGRGLQYHIIKSAISYGKENVAEAMLLKV